MAEEARNAGVIAPPPLLLLAALVAGYLADRLAPLGYLARIEETWRAAGGGVLAAAAIGLALAAVREFSRAGTPVRPSRASRELVTGGVFAHLRNPMYTAMVMLASAIALALSGDWMLLCACVLALVLHFGVVLREEAYLEGKFGEPYRAYKARTPRWGWRF